MTLSQNDKTYTYICGIIFLLYLRGHNQRISMEIRFETYQLSNRVKNSFNTFSHKLTDTFFFGNL